MSRLKLPCKQAHGLTPSGWVHTRDGRPCKHMNAAQNELLNLADPAAKKEPGEAQSATHDQREHQDQGAVLSGRSDSPTDEAEFWQNVGWG